MCGSSISELKALFEDTQAAYWARTAAMDAMTVQVLECDCERDAFVAYLIAQGAFQALRLAQAKTLTNDLEVIDCIADAAANIGAHELIGHVDRWFDDGLLDLQRADRD